MKVQAQLRAFYGGGSAVVDSFFNISPFGLLGLRALFPSYFSILNGRLNIVRSSLYSKKSDQISMT